MTKVFRDSPVGSATAGIGAVVLVGPPGAGKGTQAREMARRWGVPVVATGEMIRTLAKADTAQGARAREIMERGELIPDAWMNQLVEERLQQPDCRGGFLLDGYPRTPAQAEALTRWLVRGGIRLRVIHFRVSHDEVVRRISGRRVCPQCDAVYNVDGQPPQAVGRCDRDGTPLETRPDDAEAVVRERLRLFEKQTGPVIEFYRRSGQPVSEVDASRPVPQVSAELARMLEAA